MSHTFVFFCLFVCHLVGVSGVETDKTKSAEVMEGDSVTLHTDLTEIQGDDLILWTFGPKKTHIAKINRAHHEIFHDNVDGRFRDRLHLENQTGSLTITNTSTEHSGPYKIEIVSENQVSSKTFSVTVYAFLSIPVISSYSPSNPSSSERSPSSRCVLLCSVVNVTQVTLSWFKGNSLLSSISVPELNTTISLHLEVEYKDNNTYSCVLNNPISHRSRHLNISDLCQPEKSSCIYRVHGLTEDVIRLVISVLVGVATVAVLIYDIRSRRV
ncbi:natural killer cell receptor 2B4-like [Onychostoma macrolepis]|uniref:natural killer cell receptor 2B4-like n=1 Tax=Onychostoma macrolepis TaxID=369639 RepID=UPI00272B22E7|nr:natural killer cell receptor 2B4-like [Onychostoma macrolepis]